MKVLVTGNMGYVGPVVVGHFRAQHPAATLLGFDTGFFSGVPLTTPASPELRLDAQWYGDVRTLDGDRLRGVDAIVHLAALSNDPMGATDEALTHAINAEATAAVAAKAKAAGVKSFVFASSCSVYGAGADAPRDEGSPVDPLTAYARSKVHSEVELKKLATPDFRVTCLRFATACGMSPRLRLDLVLNDFVSTALATGKVVVLSDGSPWRPLIHVRDMARALEWGVQRGLERAGEPYLVVNAGSDVMNVQIRDLAHAVAKSIPGTEVSINTSASPDKRSYRVNFDRYKALAPGAQPSFDLHACVDDLVRGMTPVVRSPGFQRSHFVRIDTLKALGAAGALGKDLHWTAPGKGAASA